VQPFCHTWDLTKRLIIPALSHPPKYLALAAPNSNGSPFSPILDVLTNHLSSNHSIPTRLIIPSLLSPLICPPNASQPHLLVQFLHQLRALLRQHSTFTLLLTWPLALYPTTHPLTRYSRLLVDGVITLRPFPHSFSVDAIDLDIIGGVSTAKGKAEEKMQGLIKVLKLPVLSEKGVSVGAGEDMAFAVGRRRFLIRPFHLPPLEAEEHEGETRGDAGKEGKNLEF
jgi:elongator complex protein 4